MAKLTTIAEACDLEDKVTVMAIRGKVGMIGEQKSGNGEYGPYLKQNIDLQDATGKIKAVIWNNILIPKEWRGKTIEIRSTQNDKGAWVGCKKENNTWQGVTKPQLAVSAPAEIINFDAEHQPEEPAQQPPPAQQSPPQAPQRSRASNTAPQQQNAPEPRSAPAWDQIPVEETRRGPTAKEKLDDGIKILTQIANSQYAAIVLVKSYLVPLLKKRGIEIDAIQEAGLIQNILITAHNKHNAQNLFPETQFALGDTPKPPQTPPKASTDVPVDDDIPY